MAKALRVRFSPTTLSDAVDGSNALPGAMASLANLIPDLATRNIFVPRPGAVQQTGFAGFATPGFDSGLLVIGNLAYGMIASARNAGKDEPFVYDLAAMAFLTVAGIVNANTPTSPVVVGDWTPPILAQVGSRIIVTHPGFAGGVYKFGWFDISGYSMLTMGNTDTSTTITGNPSIIGVQPGMTITGTVIPANTTVVSTTSFVLTEVGVTHGNLVLDNLPSTVGVAAGQSVAGLGIVDGTTVAAVATGVVTLSQAATGSGAIDVTFGGSTIKISQAATGSTVGVNLTIEGGTRAAPLWGAGDTDRNNLPSVPLGVAQMGGRAYFACGIDGIPWSDSLLPCRISNSLAVQALTTNDGLAATANGSLQLSSLLGGIVQSLIVFEGISKMQQITGDQSTPVTAPLKMNALPVATGTLAPLSICTTPKGLIFMSPEGLRLIDFMGDVSLPIGAGGVGVSMPFIFASVPSRICTAARGETIRISTQSSLAAGAQEFWYDLTARAWSGPHSFPASLIQPWRDTFIMAPLAVTASLWRSDSNPSPSSVYSENGNVLTWIFQPTPLPDNRLLAENALVEMTLACSIAPDTTLTLLAQDIGGDVLDMTSIEASGAGAVWGAFNWGGAVWGGTGAVYRQRSVDWHVPLVFKQLNLQINGASNYNVRIGTLNMLYEILGYKLQVA